MAVERSNVHTFSALFLVTLLLQKDTDCRFDVDVRTVMSRGHVQYMIGRGINAVMSIHRTIRAHAVRCSLEKTRCYCSSHGHGEHELPGSFCLSVCLSVCLFAQSHFFLISLRDLCRWLVARSTSATNFNHFENGYDESSNGGAP